MAEQAKCWLVRFTWRQQGGAGHYGAPDWQPNLVNEQVGGATPGISLTLCPHLSIHMNSNAQDFWVWHLLALKGHLCVETTARDVFKN